MNEFSSIRFFDVSMVFVDPVKSFEFVNPSSEILRFTASLPKLTICFVFKNQGKPDVKEQKMTGKNSMIILD